MLNPASLEHVRWNADGLVPAIAQDVDNHRILMMAWMNREALSLTAETGHAVYWSRSRQQLWHKGETSGHEQRVHEIRLDCDADVITLLVEQKGGIACHTGRASCFYRVLDQEGLWQTVDPVLKDPKHIYDESQNAHTAPITPKLDTVLVELTRILELRKQSGDPAESYVAKLHHKGLDTILKKMGEECAETLLAAKDAQVNGEVSPLIYEMADLWFHSLVALSHFNLNADHVLAELAKRFNLSGLTEKAMRS
jgi:phosphoribosyl-AMP cyclohydrolase / phosphoribosyl-ATP pyrophosphohydrolase